MARPSGILACMWSGWSDVFSSITSYVSNSFGSVREGNILYEGSLLSSSSSSSINMLGTGGIGSLAYVVQWYFANF